MIVSRDVRIPLGDVTLSADVHRPDVVGPVPALLTVLPYRNDAGGGLMMASELSWFASQGYATVLVDPLGIGASDGVQRPPFDAGEVDDALAALAWLHAQPWCNGRVGMWGHSYGAILALRTAAVRPAGLEAILPVMGALDPSLDFVHPGGIRGGLGPVPTWGVATLVNQLLPALLDSGEGELQWKRRLEAEPWIVDLLRRGVGDESWRSRAIDAAAIDVPALCIAGWHDLFCEPTIRAFEQMRGPKRLIVGPWMHTMPHLTPVAAIDFRAIALKWFDRWLRDIDDVAADEPAVAVYVNGDAASWRSLSALPVGLEDVFAGDGGVVPADPTVGSCAGLVGLPAGAGMPLDQHDDDMRSLAITLEPLASDVVMVGRPEVSLDVEGEPGVVAVRICAVDESGRSQLITSGAARVESGTARVICTPCGWRVTAGERLRISVASADFPRLWPAAGTDGWRASNVRLRLPLVEAPELAAWDAPEPEPTLPLMAQHITRFAANWEVARDHATAELTVRLVEDNEVFTLDRSRLLALRQERSATVSQLAPDSAVMRAASVAVVRSAAGDQPTIEVSAQLEVTIDTWSVQATITTAGEPVFSRRWTGVDSG